MTNYSMQQGRKRNDKIKIIKRIVMFSIIFWGVVMLFQYWDRQDAKLMEIEYCWDSNGDHFLSGDNRCNL